MEEFRSNIWKMYLLRFFRGMHLISAVLIPFFTTWANLNFTQILLLQSWFAFWLFVLEIPTGVVADRFGRKISICLGTFILMLGPLVYASSPNYILFMVGEFLFALGITLISGADESLIYDTLKKMKKTKISKKIFSRIKSFWLSGLLVAGPLGSYLASIIGLQLTFQLMAIPYFIAFLITFTLKEPSDVRYKEKNYFKIMKDGIKYFRNHKIIGLLAFDLVSISTIVYFIIWLNQAVLLKIGLPIEYFGVILAACMIGQILILNNFEFLEKISGSKKGFLFLTGIIPSIAFLVLGLTEFLPAVIISIILCSSFGHSRTVLFSNYFNKFIPSNKRATVLSTASMLTRFFLFIVNPFVGMLTDWNLNYMLIILGVLGLILTFISRTEESMLRD